MQRWPAAPNAEPIKWFIAWPLLASPMITQWFLAPIMACARLPAAEARW